MMNWFQALMPKEERFFDLFEAHAGLIDAGAKDLRALLNGGEMVPDLCDSIGRLEERADTITHEVMLAVRRTFITPFDRSDIRDLISSMDDAVDQMNKTAKAITLFEQRKFKPHMQQLGDIIVTSAGLAAEAAPLLRSLRANAARLHAVTEEIIRLEDASDAVYDLGMKALYHERKDAMDFVIGSEIYDHLEKVVDRLEDVANQISGVLIEHL
jgi:predicted phosphate transport protein (TIGR00153 family)